MSVIHAPRTRQLDFRVLVFPIVLGPLLVALFLRLWFLQVVRAGEFIDRAETTRQMNVLKTAPRGLIYDRNGVLIGGIKSELVLTAIPNELKKHPETLSKAAALMNVPVEMLEKRLKEANYRPYLASPIYVGVPIEAATKIIEDSSELPGVAIDHKPMRAYRDTNSLSHILGYVWLANDKDIARLKAKGIEPAEYVGKTGIERSYEKELMGKPGVEQMELDARRRPVRVIGSDSPVPGEQLSLTIDMDLQKYCTDLLAGIYKDKGIKGGLVALDPATGEILCQVSSPGFDESLFYGGISKADLDKLQGDESKPLINRTIASQNSPGSTFKIVTSIAAYRTGKLSPSTTAFCSGGYTLGRRTLKCLGHHGSIGFGRAMEKSCNTYFCTLGMNAGPEALCQAATDCGLGQRTGIELVGEYKGVVPNEKWLNHRKKPIKWYGGDTLNMSVGQGYVAATPIQMANLVSMVANRGVIYTPHLVRGLRAGDTGDFSKIEPKISHEVKAEGWFWDMLQSALTSVIDSGTAASARIPGVQWAGKTGSTEHGRRTGKTHSWFVGYAPAQSPKIAICMFAEAAGHGGEISAPIARDVVAHYLANLAKASAKSSSSSGNQLGTAVR